MTAIRPIDEDAAALWRAWRDGAPLLDVELRALYDRLDAEVTRRGPTCWTSGKCCNFDAYGHRLYVTGLEIAWVLQGLPPGRRPSAKAIDLTGSCVFQVDGLCSVHAIRPLGCRVFFCQQGTQEWQHELYERFLGDLRLLHARHGLPYRYMEWRAGLHESLRAAGSI